MAGALMGLGRLHSVVSDPTRSDTAAVATSKYLIDLAIGPGGLPALTAPLEPGAACSSCGHHEASPGEQAAALARVREQFAH